MKNNISDKTMKPLGEYTHARTYRSLENKRRIQSFDIARTFAILCVVLCHSADIAYSNISYMYLSNSSQIFRIIMLTIGRLGVPIFLFLSGALLLKKQIETDEDIIKFYKRNLLPLFITVEIWNIIYNLFNWWITGQFSIKILLKNILFLQQVSMPNMWYMPMILGMYLAMPFVAKIVKSFSLRIIRIPMIIVFIASIVLPSVNIIFNVFKLGSYKIILDLTFLGGGYGLYILLGYYINNELLKNIRSMVLTVIFIFMFLATCFIQYYSYIKGIIYNVWYNFIALFICSICIFELFRRIKNNESKNASIKITEYISKVSLGIFFIHEILLNIIRKYICKFNLKNPLEVIILFILSFTGSIVVIYLTSRFKILKERLFLIKE